VQFGGSCRNGEGSRAIGNAETCLHVTIEFKPLLPNCFTTLASFVSFPHTEHSEEFKHQTLFFLSFFNVNIWFWSKNESKGFSCQELSPEFWISSATADNFSHS